MTFEEFILTILAAGYSFHYLNLVGHIDGMVVYYPDKTAGVIDFPRESIYDNAWDERMDELSQNMQIVI